MIGEGATGTETFSGRVLRWTSFVSSAFFLPCRPSPLATRSSSTVLVGAADALSFQRSESASPICIIALYLDERRLTGECDSLSSGQRPQKSNIIAEERLCARHMLHIGAPFALGEKRSIGSVPAARPSRLTCCFQYESYPLHGALGTRTTKEERTRAQKRRHRRRFDYSVPR